MKDFARPASSKKAATVTSTSEVYLAGLDTSSQFVGNDTGKIDRFNEYC